MVNGLKDKIINIRPVREMKNEWLWLETEVFSASSAYRVRLEDIGQIEDFIVFQDLWKVKVPPMVLFMI